MFIGSSPNSNTRVFAPQFQFVVLQSLNLTHLTTTSSIASFAEWWIRSWKKLQKQHRKCFNSLYIFRIWILCKLMNACVLRDVSKSAAGSSGFQERNTRISVTVGNYWVEPEMPFLIKLAIMPVRCNGRKKYYMISSSVNMEQIHLI